MSMATTQSRARAYAALGDPSRLTIVDLLADGDLASGELATRLDLPSNLLAHHLQVLEQAGLIQRRRSEGDGRRAYVQRTPACDLLLGAAPLPRPQRVAFVCSHNSARSQLAEAYWRTVSDIPAISAGTHPATRVHPRAVAVGRTHGLDLSAARPKLIDNALTDTEMVIAVCDRAYEELPTAAAHWAVPDPALTDTDEAFEAAFTDITSRIDLLANRFQGEPT